MPERFDTTIYRRLGTLVDDAAKAADKRRVRIRVAMYTWGGPGLDQVPET
ncbi:hypothetical protein [Streptomyces sp. AJS327]|nr:hypothetical protein [Streptomyces sp. AJS327]